MYKVNPENKEASIQYLVDKNRSAFPGLSIKWISWLRAPQEGKSVASLIIEVADPGVANRMIDEGTVTGAHMHSCTLYNPDCRMKQCFRCLQYGHKAIKCTKEISCNKCSGQHKASGCTSSALKCAFCQGGHGSFDKNCPQRRKEVDKIKAAQLATPQYHEMEARTESTAKGNSLEFPTPAETTRSTALPNPELARRPTQEIGIEERTAGPRTNTSTRRKRGVPLNIFEEMEKTPEVNTTIRRRGKEKDDRQRSRSPARTDRRTEEPRS